ncbi:MAG: hypothetical protein AB1629_00195 [Candidatus Omnitrophota bacterium]
MDFKQLIKLLTFSIPNVLISIFAILFACLFFKPLPFKRKLTSILFISIGLAAISLVFFPVGLWLKFRDSSMSLPFILHAFYYLIWALSHFTIGIGISNSRRWVIKFLFPTLVIFLILAPIMTIFLAIGLWYLMPIGNAISIFMILYLLISMNLIFYFKLTKVKEQFSLEK